MTTITELAVDRTATLQVVAEAHVVLAADDGRVIVSGWTAVYGECEAAAPAPAMVGEDAQRSG